MCWRDFSEKRGSKQGPRSFAGALKSQPEGADAGNVLAWVLATSPNPAIRNANKAVELAQQANALSRGTNPVILGTLAAANAEVGHFPDAAAMARQALHFAAMQNNADTAALITALQVQLKSYQAGSPFRDPSLKNVSTAPNQP